MTGKMSAKEIREYADHTELESIKWLTKDKQPASNKKETKIVRLRFVDGSTGDVSLKSFKAMQDVDFRINGKFTVT